MKYKASLDATSKVITALISVLFFSIIVIQFVLFFQQDNWYCLATAALLILIYIVTYFYSPVDYQVEEKNIIVHRPASDIVLSRSEIKNIELIQQVKLQGTVRTFGVGGLFGYFGQFMNHELGCMTWYATKHDKRVVLIEMNNNKKIIITPDEPEQFVRQVSNVA